MSEVRWRRRATAAVLSAGEAARLAHEAELQGICVDLRRIILAAEPDAPPLPRPCVANSP